MPSIKKVEQFIEWLIKTYDLPLSPLDPGKWKFKFARWWFRAERIWEGAYGALIIGRRTHDKAKFYFCVRNYPGVPFHKRKCLPFHSTDMLDYADPSFITYAAFAAAFSVFPDSVLHVTRFVPRNNVDIWFEGKRYCVMDMGKFTIKRGMPPERLKGIIKRVRIKAAYERL